MDTWVIYVIAPIAVALVSWMLGRNGRRIDETAKVVSLLQDEIGRLTRKVDVLEIKLEAKEDESERKSMIIQEAFKCRTPSYKCPVLTLQNRYNQEKSNYVKRIEEPESGEYPSKPDPVQGGDCECRPGL